MKIHTDVHKFLDAVSAAHIPANDIRWLISDDDIQFFNKI